MASRFRLSTPWIRQESVIKPIVRAASVRVGWPHVAAAGILILYLWHCLLINFVVDDSFITFRYAQNLVSGHGLVYNVGQRVEGYTNFLWVVLLAVGTLGRPDADLVAIAQALGVAFGFGTILLVLGFFWRTKGASRLTGLLAAASLALNGSFVAWSTAGLETTLFASLVCAGLIAYALWRENRRAFLLAPFLLTLAALTRPEGLLFLGLTALHFLFTSLRRSEGRDLRRVALWFAPPVGIYLPYFVWRFAYYGFFFPNTFYAKVGAGLLQYLRGGLYLFNYARAYGILPFLLPLLLVLKSNRKPWGDFLLWQTAAFLAYIVYVGGDGLGFYRFVALIAPLLAILGAEGLSALYNSAVRLVPAGNTRIFAAAGVLVAGVMFGMAARPTMAAAFYPTAVRWYEPQSELTFPLENDSVSYLWFDDYFVQRQAAAARWLSANAAPGAVVASTPAGAIAYYSGLEVIDMLGLTDAHIAHSAASDEGAFGGGRAGHEKGDGAYVLSRAPDYILMGNVAVLPFPLDEQEMAKKLVLKSENELWSSPEFHDRYKLVCVQLPEKQLFRYFTFYQRKDIDPSHVDLNAGCGG